MKTATERWDAHFDKAANPTSDEVPMDYAMMPDWRTLVIFDDEPDGYFFIKTDKEGTIYAELRDGTRGEIYCEPVWLSGWTDPYFFHEEPTA